MVIDQKTLAKLKQALLDEKVELESSLNRIAKPIDASTGDYEVVFTEIGNDREDNTTEVEEYTDNLPVEITLEKKLQAILTALDKMEKGSYGICDNCKKEITIERLRANPSAQTCIKC
jgi:RNA polymerase-binding transcription factor DksA